MYIAQPIPSKLYCTVLRCAPHPRESTAIASAPRLKRAFDSNLSLVGSGGQCLHHPRCRSQAKSRRLFTGQKCLSKSASHFCSAATRSRGSQLVCTQATVDCTVAHTLAIERLERPTSRAANFLAGALTTAAVLSVGFGAFINGNKELAQYMMRARVVAQGATVIAMVVSAGGLFLPSKVQAE